MLSFLDVFRSTCWLQIVSPHGKTTGFFKWCFYFNINHLFFEGQHGFRESHSCETALHELITRVNNNRDKRLITLLLFIDFRKAFDLVSADNLMRKLFQYGFDNKSIKLLTNYFTNRTQYTKIKTQDRKEHKSEPVETKLGTCSTRQHLTYFFFFFLLNSLCNSNYYFSN